MGQIVVLKRAAQVFTSGRQPVTRRPSIFIFRKANIGTAARPTSQVKLRFEKFTQVPRGQKSDLSETKTAFARTTGKKF